MAIDSGALKNWAKQKGALQPIKSKKDIAPAQGETGPDDESDGDEDSGSDEDDTSETESAHEPLWAGDQEGDLGDSIDAEAADRLLSWLQDNEPEIYETVDELAEAIVEDDSQAIEHGKDELGWVEQRDADGYPELSEEQRDAMAGKLQSELSSANHPAKDSPEWKIAVAKAIAESRQEDAGGMGFGHEDDDEDYDEDDEASDEDDEEKDY